MDTNSSRLTDDLLATLRRGADSLRAGMVKFAQDLIARPSLPGQEKDVADRVVQEMKALGYDNVQVDATGNVIGMIYARNQDDAPKRSVMFNTHMDQVDVGDHTRWPYPPFEGRIVDGHIYGRGSS